MGQGTLLALLSWGVHPWSCGVAGFGHGEKDAMGAWCWGARAGPGTRVLSPSSPTEGGTVRQVGWSLERHRWLSPLRQTFPFMLDPSFSCTSQSVLSSCC